MLSPQPLKLLPEDKLDLLRYLDEFRFWHSLDDERRCTRCHHTISGRQILVFEPPGTRGRMKLQCPTADCASTPSDWVYANPVLAASFTSNPPRRKFDTSSGNKRIIRVARRRSSRPAVHAGSKPALSKVRESKLSDHRPTSIRAFLQRLPILRPLVSGFHSIQPVG